MKLFCLVSLLSLFTIGQTTAQEAVERVIAFPGAEGFGRYASGGRSGKVYHVTTLEDGRQEGTFRHAINQHGPRTIVFDVAGTIMLQEDLRITNGDLTIAGQTAPGQGICLANRAVTISANNVIVRYLRFRVGNEGGGREPDGLGASRCRDLIIDHCSVSWSVDECCSVYGGWNNTVQWCLISESLRDAGHGKGAHGYGGIVGGDHSSFHHNLMAHHDSRTPRLGPSVQTQRNEHTDMRNNVIYNWAGNGCYGGEGMHVNIVNNYYKPGPATPTNTNVGYRIASINIRTTQYVTGRNGRPNAWKPMEHIWGTFYVDGNIMEGHPDVTADNWTKGMYEQIDVKGNDGTFTEEVKKNMKLAAPIDYGVVTTHTAQDAYNLVLKYAGCSKSRDIIDTRIVEETKTGKATYRGSITKGAGLIDTPRDVMPKGANSPWPELSDGGVTAESLRDTDGDGIPDVYEVKMNLNPNNRADGNILNSDGYTNLEVYLNMLVADITKAQNKS
ncbi:pectate lyase [Bacteroides sp. 214]|uniref:pectate lyase family protein n=1 Tax=Bacteroides sp. 214 TaxID=2302935 RepID=UPI0013D65B04|nr:pectate lyase [Bacteroides sp. 214]NDW12462.1 pectate lyase [Bacteroides sp. 214]